MVYTRCGLGNPVGRSLQCLDGEGRAAHIGAPLLSESLRSEATAQLLYPSAGVSWHGCILSEQSGVLHPRVGGPQAMSRGALDAEIEAWICAVTRCNVDFDLDDAAH